MHTVLSTNHPYVLIIHTYRTTAGMHISPFQIDPFEQVTAWLLFTEVLTEELAQGLLQLTWPFLVYSLWGHDNNSHHHHKLIQNIRTYYSAHRGARWGINTLTLGARDLSTIIHTFHIHTHNIHQPPAQSFSHSIWHSLGCLPGTNSPMQSAVLWPALTARCSSHCGIQLPTPFACPLSTQPTCMMKEEVMQVLHSHATHSSSANACTVSSASAMAPPQSTCYLCPACSQSHLARLGKLLAQCSQVNRTAWASQTVFEDRTYDSTTATNI